MSFGQSLLNLATNVFGGGSVQSTPGIIAQQGQAPFELPPWYGGGGGGTSMPGERDWWDVLDTATDITGSFVDTFGGLLGPAVQPRIPGGLPDQPQQPQQAGILSPAALLAIAQQTARTVGPYARRAAQLIGAGGTFAVGEEGASRLMANDVTFDPSGQPGMACGLFRPRAGGAMARTSIRPSPIIVIPNPETGKPTFFLHAGEPTAWSKWTKKTRRTRKR
ncbi:MAG: hypothetical protein ABGY41_18055 [Candidatus Poribacteria bacterium]